MYMIRRTSLWGSNNTNGVAITALFNNGFQSTRINHSGWSEWGCPRLLLTTGGDNDVSSMIIGDSQS